MNTINNNKKNFHTNIRDNMNHKNVTNVNNNQNVGGVIPGRWTSEGS